ncbi:MAG: RimK/LysX family protein [Actinomycetota bacterium]
MNAERANTIGWREWVTLPRFCPAPIKAKVDTGAKTSSLHAEDLTVIEQDDEVLVRFEFYPELENRETMSVITAPVVDFRTIKSSNGQTQTRPVIRTEMEIGGRSFDIDLTLTSRSTMGHRMLLGRRFLENRYHVDPAKSFVLTGEERP